MAFKHIDLDSAFRRLAEKRIEDAMKEGKFDNLPGKGQPLNLEPMPASEEARLTWWAMKLLRQNDFTPDEIRWRKQIDGLKGELAESRTEARVAALVAAINAKVKQLNTLGTNALKDGIAPVSLEAELDRLRERTMPTTPAPVKCLTSGCGQENPAGADYCRRCGGAIARPADAARRA